MALYVVVAGLLGLTVVWFAYRGYCVRLLFRQLQKQEIPMMSHHPIFGHLIVIDKLMAGMPKDMHGDYLPVLIMERWKDLFPACSQCPPVVYLDLWPFMPPMLLSLNPDVSAQFTQDHNLDKAHSTATFLHPLTANLDVSSNNGARWRMLRHRLAPGFSARNITARVPNLLEEVEVFVDVLRQNVGQDGDWGPVFSLQKKATLLTLDFIGRFTMDVRLHEQTSPLTPFSAGLLDILPCLNFHVHIGNLLEVFSPWKLFRVWRDSQSMDAYLLPLLRQRISALGNANEPETRKAPTLIDALVRSMADEGEPERTFLPYALAETKHTMFAGHETTAFTLAWILYTLQCHPEMLDKVREEHDTVLGPNPAASLRQSPQLLGQLVYTNAVIKETMRVHTNVGTMREGQVGFSLYGPADSDFGGVAFPTGGCVVWDANFAIHRDPRIWPRPTEIVPERWLATDPADPLYPHRNAFRAFVQGPRNCIGQYLALAELKMALALVVREFEVETAWDEWDRAKYDGWFFPFAGFSTNS